jgi:hypothetical protein
VVVITAWRRRNRLVTPALAGGGVREELAMNGIIYLVGLVVVVLVVLSFLGLR